MLARDASAPFFARRLELKQPHSNMKKIITTLTDEGKTRAKMVQEYQQGASAADLAKKYRYEVSMVYKYVRDYEQEDIAALNKERRVRETVKLTPAQWRAHLAAATDEREREYLTTLLRIAEKKVSLSDAATGLGITPQGLMKIRRKYAG